MLLQEEEKPAEKDAFDLKLVSFDDKSKIKVIKEVRTISGLGLKEVRLVWSSRREWMGGGTCVVGRAVCQGCRGAGWVAAGGFS